MKLSLSEADFSFGGIRYDDESRVLMSANGESLRLRNQSLEVFSFLAKREGKVVGKDELFAAIWEGRLVTDDALVQCIAEIRRVIGDKKHRILKTVPRRGYLLKADRVFDTEVKSAPLTKTSPPTQAATSCPDRPGIAVMNFENLNPAPPADEQILVRGLTTDIHLNLAKISHLSVISQLSSGQLSHLRPAEAGRQLGVDYLVQGVVQFIQHQLNITVSLINSHTEQVIWAERYHLSRNECLSWQADISQTISSELDYQLERVEMRRSLVVPTESLRAWEYYHRGLHYVQQTNQQGIEAATAAFQQAIALDQNYSRAYACLAMSSIHRIFLSPDSSDETIKRLTEQAYELAYTAIECDVNEPWGHYSLGRVQYIRGEHGASILSLDHALTLKPNFTWACYTRSLVGSTTGDDKEICKALTFADESLRLSPYDPMMFSMQASKALAFFMQGDEEQAACWIYKAVQHPNAYHLIYAMAAIFHQYTGQSEAARQYIRRALQLYPHFSQSNFFTSLPHADIDHVQCRKIRIALEKLRVPA
ncbi:MAG: winged helix-turn-helix domain-containing protein [Thiolinea sp.]